MDFGHSALEFYGVEASSNAESCEANLAPPSNTNGLLRCFGYPPMQLETDNDIMYHIPYPAELIMQAWKFTFLQRATLLAQRLSDQLALGLHLRLGGCRHRRRVLLHHPCIINASPGETCAQRSC